MRARMTLTALTIAALVATAAGAQTKTLTCKDGTASTAVGKGACSGHGGVKKASKASKKAEQAEKKVEKTADKAENKVEKTADKAETKIDKAEKKEVAAVTCSDGTKGKAGRGACSGHGGIKKA